MEQHEMMQKVDEILEFARAAVMACSCGEGKPQMRWMTPITLKNRPGALYTVTSPTSTKVKALKENPDVEWMIQTPTLDEVVNLKGRVNILDNPSIRAEVMEKMVKRLTVFWKINPEDVNFIVLETIIDEAQYFLPMEGTKVKMKFV